MSYILLPDAQQDFRDIGDWVFEQFGLAFAERTEANLYETFGLLAKYPHIGRAIPDVLPSPFRFFHLRPYWIAYEPGKTLLIHRIFHAARDLNRLNLK